MSARRIAIEQDGSVIVLRGWRVAELARQAGMRPTYAGTVRGWVLDAHRLPDLIGWLEYRNVRYDLTGEPPKPSRSVAAITDREKSDSPEWALW